MSFPRKRESRLMTLNRQHQIILASASPRRRQLLAEAGYKFTVVPSQIDELSFSTQDVSPIDYAKQLALAKAKDVACNHPDSLVIGADTVVDFDGRIVGKPADAKDAERITRMLFSKPHKVITALALVCKIHKLQIVEAETTIVYPKKLTDSQIAEHIASGIWRDKSGAYAIKEHGDPFVDHIDGSLTNVMGLPIELLKRLLSYKEKK
jgi:septum formation protein